MQRNAAYGLFTRLSRFIRQYHPYHFFKTADYHIRMRRGLLFPGSDQYPPGADGLSSQHINILVTYYKRSLQVNAMLHPRFDKHAGSRLPALAIVIGTVGTIIKVFKSISPCKKRINILCKRFFNQTPRYARLIGHPDKEKPLLLKFTKTLNTREYFEILPVAEKVGVPAQGAVPVKKNCPGVREHIFDLEKNLLGSDRIHAPHISC